MSLLSSDQDAIYEIEEALRRIEKNTYGICELTGKSIPKARLEAIPWTRFTVEAQAQLEREGALRQKRLGALGSVDSPGASEADEDEEADEKPTKERSNLCPRDCYPGMHGSAQRGEASVALSHHAQ